MSHSSTQNSSTPDAPVVTSDAAHACPKCHKTFSRAVNRDRHLATHNQVPSLACNICQRRFHRADVLAKHIQRHRGGSLLPQVHPPSPAASSSQAQALQHTASVHGQSPVSYAQVNREQYRQPSVRSLAASRKVARACSRCSKAKARCDGHLPACGRCTRLDKMSMCSYDAPSDDAVTAAATADASVSSQAAFPRVKVAAPSATPTSSASRPGDEAFDLGNATTNSLNVPVPRTDHRQANVTGPVPSLPSDPASHLHRQPDPFDWDSWRQPQAHLSHASSWGSTTSPLPLDWLLQNEIPDNSWTAYLGDPGVPLLANFFDYADAASSRPRAEAQNAAALSSQPSQHAQNVFADNADGGHAFGHQVRETLHPWQNAIEARASQTAVRTPNAHTPSSTTSPATMDAATAAATLARIRSEAVHRGFLRSATPSEDESGSSRGSSPDPHFGNVRGDSTTNLSPSSPLRTQRRTGKGRRKRDTSYPDGLGRANAQRPSSPHSRDSSSESSDLDPMERANRDVAAQPRQHRVSYRHPDPSARSHLDPSPAAPSPEDIARQEAVVEEMAQLAHEAEQAHGRSPLAASDRSSKRRKRRHKYWPSVYRPKATDGGRHLSLQRVPFASAEVTALENSYQVAPMTNLAKERMIDEFRYCEVEAQDLRRIQDTLRSIETSTLNLFLQLYFEHHDPILPILHRATFDPDTCDPLLLAAVTCLGALCSKAENAFAYSLLTSSLVHAVSYKLIGINHLRGRYLPSMQTLLLTYALWRNLGDPAKLEYLEGFRNIVLTMARRCRLFELDSFDSDPNFLGRGVPEQINPDLFAANREAEWHRWIRNQEMVRISWALLILDSDLSLAWDLPCTVTISELRSPLPCVESLWQAETAEDWASMEDEHHISAQRILLRHILQPPFGSTTHSSNTTAAPGATCESANTDARHTSPLTHLVLSAALHNVALSRWNLDTVLTQLVDLHDTDDGDVTDRETTVPKKDPDLERWADAIATRLHTLSSNRLDASGKSDAQLMLHGARLRMLVSFKAVQIMSGRKGHRRSKVQMKRWLQGPLQNEQYRNDVFREASKIFALSLAARRDIAPLSLEPASHTAASIDRRPRSGSRNSATSYSERGVGHDPGLSTMGHSSVSGTGAENSILFYATVCLVLLCQSLVRDQSTPKFNDGQSQATTVGDAAIDTSKATLNRAASLSRKTRKKDVFFLQGVGALTNPVSLDRLVHVAVHQGLNRSAWPLGHVLGKVLQQWARTLAR